MVVVLSVRGALLPLLGKPFIEAAMRATTQPSSRPELLPLLGKPFIEARTRRPHPSSPRHCFPFWGSPSLRRGPRTLRLRGAGALLPLLGKPFIEAHDRFTGAFFGLIASPSGEALH